jgi:cephalosporin-C deacetylase-like acetyl esterase
VGGVSWYEAAAYAEFAGKTLPTIDHWKAAAAIQLGAYQPLAALSNFGGNGPVAVGSTSAISGYGAFDMAGNVREWCSNASGHGRCLRGGAWNDQTYMYGNVSEAPTLDRSETNGFRCAVYLDGHTPSAEMLAPYRSDTVRDFAKEKPVSDEVFAVYRRLLDYDARDLQARVEARDDTHLDWIRERVSFTAVYGEERVTAQVYLPRTSRPPFQVVVFFPGSDATVAESSDKAMDRLPVRYMVSHFISAGRALVYPVYKGTHERNDGKPDYYEKLHLSCDSTREYADYQKMIVQDARRSLDYVESRADLDPKRVAFFGWSWGGVVAPMVLGVEDRFAAAVLASGTLPSWGRPRGEADPLNYAPRVRIPVLMLNGRYDLETEATAHALYEMLGTPQSRKVLKVYESGHAIPRTEMIRESLAWLDRYLGPVN